MKYVFGIAIVVALVMAAWAMLAPAVTNIVFQDELRDISAQLGWRTGISGPNSEEEFRNIVIRRAEKHEIPLQPKQVTAVRSGAGEQVVVFIAVDYTVPVDLLVYSFALHFNPTSRGGPFWPKIETLHTAKPQASPEKVTRQKQH